MKHVKLFEEYSIDGNSPINNSVRPKSYIYYITNKNDKNFKAVVRDPDGKIIFELKVQDISNDGYMNGKDDIIGLHKLLVSKNKIKQGDIILSSDAASAAVDCGINNNFSAPLNTNIL